MAHVTGLNTAVIFFGGLGDRSIGHLVEHMVTQYTAKQVFGPAADIHYLEWNSAAFWSHAALKIVKSLQGKSIALIGHSYGGHSAYKVAVDAGIEIAFLGTVDAVSWQSKLRWNDKPRLVKCWRNVWIPGTSDYTDWVAVAGGRWGPKPGAINSQAAKGTSHANFGSLFQPLIPEVIAALSGAAASRERTPSQPEIVH